MQGASTRTRSNEPLPHGGSVPSATVTPSTPGAPVGRAPPPVGRAPPTRRSSGVETQRAADQLGTVGLELVGDDQGPAVDGQRGEQGRLAARAGAQVEPPGVGALDRSRRQGERHQLGSLVLHPGPSLGDGRQRAGIAAVGDDAVRRVRRRPPGQLAGARATRPRDEGDGRGCVVGGEQRIDLVRSPRLGQGGVQRVHDPLRVGEPGRAVGAELGEPGVEVMRRDPAQDGVDEPGRARADLGADQVDAGADRRVWGDPHPEQLVAAESEHVEDLGRGVGQRAVGAGGQDGVVGPLPPDRAGCQLGGEGRVAAAEAVLAEVVGQDEVGVGVLRPDRLQHLEGRPPGRVRAVHASPVGRAESRPARNSLASDRGATASHASVSTSRSSSTSSSPSRLCWTRTAW